MADKLIYHITQGISVAVETFYKADHFEQYRDEHLFAYRITIENLSGFPIKLQSRHWDIIDAFGQHRVVEGDGVVGEQPILNQEETYTYISAVNMESEIGKMYGFYTMINLYNNRTFDVLIPEFMLVVPKILN